MENVAQENEKAISGAIKIDEKEIRTHLDGLVRQSSEGYVAYGRLRQVTFVVSNRSGTNVRKTSDTTEQSEAYFFV